MKIDFEQLNIISAGAGSGKTYTVQKTLSEWIKEKPEEIKPEKILAVTFTNMAANEMKTRVKGALLSAGNMDAAMRVSSAQISTIHSFGQNIIQSFAYEEGISPNVRQLTEAEGQILLQLALSSHPKINIILQELEAFGYKLSFKGGDFSSALEQVQSRVLQIINSLRTIGATEKKIGEYIDSITKEVTELYGEIQDADILNNILHTSVKALIGSYDYNLKEDFGGSKAADDALTADYEALKRALDFKNIQNDMGLWKSLQNLRLTKIKDAVYLELASAVIESAKKLSNHPKPLEEALFHIGTILEISIDTLNSYGEAKKRNALIDFSDMVHIANSIMNDDILIDEMASTYDCLVIDEFQDTNPIQFALLWKFREKGLPTLIVGDLKQSIMGFQGADASLFESLMGSDKDAIIHNLESNYRSTPALMDWINAMAKGIYGEKYHFLKSESKYLSVLTPLQIIDFDEDHWSAQGSAKTGKLNYGAEQYNVISAHIKKLIDSKTLIWDRNIGKQRVVQPSDIAILGASHAMLAKSACALRESGFQAQIKEQGWFSSNIVQLAYHALCYLSNPSDKHSALYMMVTELGDMSLQEALDMYLMDGKKFTHQILDLLDETREKVRTYTLSRQIIGMIESLKLWDYILQNENFSQERANLLKLIELCFEFESLQFESLNALGIYGRGMNSFLSWLSIADNDSQPSAKSVNTQAVQLSTWHASKGLEWPIVVVMGLDNNKKTSLPNVSIGYKNESRTNPLENSYIKFFTEFSDETTNDLFINELSKDTHKTVDNLLYVAMTRAREQLILPWPSFNKTPGEYSFMTKLIDKCKLEVNKNEIKMFALERKNGFYESVIRATFGDEDDKLDIKVRVNYGRVAIEKMDKKLQISAQISPSTTNEENNINIPKISLQAYGDGVDLSQISMSATELGTLLHHCYHTLLVDENMADRLFNSLVVKFNADIFEQIKSQVGLFQKHAKSELNMLNVKCEVPILSKTEEGRVVSGSIDLLIECDDGYWIIDHKSDRVDDFSAQFAYHYEQLISYVNFTKLDKPIKGIGINWIRYGKISLIGIE